MPGNITETLYIFNNIENNKKYFICLNNYQMFSVNTNALVIEKHEQYTNNIRLNNTHILMLVFNLTLISNNAMMKWKSNSIILSIQQQQKQQTSNFKLCNTNCNE